MPGVRRPPGLHRGRERAHRLLERRLRVEPVAVEDVDVVEAHPGQALVERAQQVLARPPLAVRAPATCRSRPWSRSPARRGRAGSPGRRSCRSWSPPSRTAGRSCWPGRSGSRPRSKARRRIARWVSIGLSSPKLCHRPSETAGSFSPRPAAAAVGVLLVAVVGGAVGLGGGHASMSTSQSRPPRIAAGLPEDHAGRPRRGSGHPSPAPASGPGRGSTARCRGRRRCR